MGTVRFLGIFRLFIALSIVTLIAGCGGGGGGSGSSTSGITSEQVEQIESASVEITSIIQNSSDSTSTDTILEEAKTTALSQTTVESADIVDEQLVVKYKDAGQEVWVINTPKFEAFDTSDNLSELNATSESYIVNKLASNVILTKGSTGTCKAVLINALDEDPGFAYLKDTFKDMKSTLDSLGYNVILLYGPDASPDKMKSLSDSYVLIMLGHGGCDKESSSPFSIYRYGVQTGKPWDDLWIDKVSDWAMNRYFKMTVPWGKGDEKERKKHLRSFYALTGQFWKDAYDSSHFNNTLFMNLACSSSKYDAYYNDLFSVGVKAYTGWSDIQSQSPNSACKMLKLMAKQGKTFDDAYDDLPSKYKSDTESDNVRSWTATLWHGPKSGYSWKLNNSEVVVNPNPPVYVPPKGTDITDLGTGN